MAPIRPRTTDTPTHKGAVPSSVVGGLLALFFLVLLLVVLKIARIIHIPQPSFGHPRQDTTQPEPPASLSLASLPPDPRPSVVRRNTHSSTRSSNASRRTTSLGPNPQMSPRQVSPNPSARPPPYLQDNEVTPPPPAYVRVDRDLPTYDTTAEGRYPAARSHDVLLTGSLFEGRASPEEDDLEVPNLRSPERLFGAEASTTRQHEQSN